MKVFSEKAGGKDVERVQLKKAIAALEAGDMLTVNRVDRPSLQPDDQREIHDVGVAARPALDFEQRYAAMDGVGD